MSNLNPSLGVLAGLECLSDDQERLQEYLAYLETRYPASGEDIAAAVDCYDSTQNTYECMFGPLSDFFKPSMEEKGLCAPIVEIGEASLDDPKLSPFWEALSDRVFSSDLYNDDLTPFWRSEVNELISFYLSRIPSLRGEIDGAWRGNFEERLARYDAQFEEPEALGPFTCSGDYSFERHELVVSGLPYTIPVFAPHDESHPWEFYETDLLYVFHVLKVFLSPEDLNHILRPGHGRNDLSVYFWSDIAGSKQLLRGCLDTPAAGDGVYQDDNNTVSIDASSNDPIIGEEGPYLDEIDVELHEFAHAIHDLFPIDQSALEEFYQWSKRQVELGNSLGYGPVPFPEDQFDSPYDIYAFRDSHEFFAEMVTEYFIHKLMSENAAESWNDTEMTPPRQAQLDLMEKFFEGGRIHPEAISFENIRQAHQDADIAYDPKNWYPEERVEWIMNTGGDMGALIFIGERTTSPPFDFGLGGVVRIESPLDYDPVISFEFEGTFRLEDLWNYYPDLSVGAEAVLRMGIQFEDRTIAPVISLGMRFIFSKFISYASGFHLIAGFFKEIDPLNGEYPFYGTIGLGYDL